MQPSGLITLELAKFSRAEDASPDVQQFSWKHETQDLVAVFDTFRVGGSSSQLLKVVQRTQVLEEIELEDLIEQGNRLSATMMEHGVEMRSEQLPISALVRCPLLAVRYLLRPTGKVRRIQLKFASSHKYDIAFSHLHQLGLRMSAAQPPASASTTLSARPGSGGPSCPPSKLAEINRPYTAVPAAASPTPQLSSTPSLQLQLGEVSTTRPVSAFSGLVNRGRNALATPLCSDPLVPPEYFPKPPSSAAYSFPMSTPALSTIEEVPSEVPSVETLRPQTALARPGTSDTLLPPRRELPFARSPPRSSGSDTVRPSSRASSGLMGPPPLPSSTYSGDRRSNSSQGQIQDPELPPLPRPTIVEDTVRTPNSRPASNQSPSYGKRTLSKVSTNENLENRLPTSSSLSSSPRSPKGSNAATSTHTCPLRNLGQGAQNQRQSETNNASPSPPSEATYQERLISELSNVEVLSPRANLTTYAMQSEDARMAALNNFILQHLEDNSFLTLVEDMEACWARIGLGL